MSENLAQALLHAEHWFWASCVPTLIFLIFFTLCQSKSLLFGIFFGGGVGRFKTGFPCVAVAVLDLALSTRLALNSEIWPSLLSFGIKDVHYHCPALFYLFKKIHILFIVFCVCESVHVYTCALADSPWHSHRGQRTTWEFILLPCGFQGSIAGHQTWQ